MATYTTLRRGSSGDEVKKYQQTLKDAGYSIDVDGKYGPQTESITKTYQKANGLSVDGIAGNQTLGKLYGGSTATTTPAATTQNNTYTYEDFTPDPFTKSDELTNIGTKYNDKLNNPYVMQESPWSQKVTDIMDQIEGREDFSYDLNSDALYQQYADQYTTQGQLAMMDTMGQAAAMTGGYGNSYAQGVGQQVYQGYLQQLNDKVPELYQLALSQYNQEGQDLKDMLSIYNGLAQQDYEKERDMVSDHYTEIGLLGDQYDRMLNEEYGVWSDMTGIEQTNHTNRQSYKLQEKQDAYTHAMSLLSLGITPEPDVLATAGISSKEAQAIIDKVNQGTTVSGNKYTDIANDGDITNDGVLRRPSNKDNGGGGNDNTGTSVTEIPESIRTKCASFKSNTELESYLDDLEFNGTITETQADQLYAEYIDRNEKFIKDGNGKDTTTYSYSDMAKSANGWKVIDDGGANLFGIDKDAIVETPNGEQITLKALRQKLKDEGMSQSKANDVIKTLQQNLDISSNWLFGW